MPRRAEIQPRQLEADSVYGSVLVTQLDQQRHARRQEVDRRADRLRRARARIREDRQAGARGARGGRSRPSRPCSRCARAASVAPTTRCPIEVPQRRARTLAIRWIVQFARDRREKRMRRQARRRAAWTRSTSRAARTRRRTTSTGWRRPTRPSRTTAGRTETTEHHCHTRRAGPRPEHRDHGAHRRRQDDDDRADPLLHRPHPQDGRGARGRRDDGLDGAGAGARHHDHVCGDDRGVARPSDQHYRYARARGLYRRGRAQPARPRRRRRRLRLRRRRPAAVRDRLAPGRPLRRAAHRVHQQDGPHRRGLLRRRAVDARPPRRATPVPIQLPIGRRSITAASSTSSR